LGRGEGGEKLAAKRGNTLPASRKRALRAKQAIEMIWSYAGMG
jgi:hypothetical protein